MLYADLQEWRRTMGLTIQAACTELGISYGSWTSFRRSSDKPLPRYVSLACASLYHRIGEWERPVKQDGARVVRRRHMARASLRNLKKGGA